MKLAKTQECWKDVDYIHCGRPLEVQTTYEWGAEGNAMCGQDNCPYCGDKLQLDYEVIYHVS